MRVWSNWPSLHVFFYLRLFLRFVFLFPKKQVGSRQRKLIHILDRVTLAWILTYSAAPTMTSRKFMLWFLWMNILYTHVLAVSDWFLQLFLDHCHPTYYRDHCNSHVRFSDVAFAVPFDVLSHKYWLMDIQARDDTTAIEKTGAKVFDKELKETSQDKVMNISHLRRFRPIFCIMSCQWTRYISNANWIRGSLL